MSKPVRIPEETKDKLFDFVKDRTVRRGRNKVCPMKPGEGVDFLLGCYNDMNLMKAYYRFNFLLRIYMNEKIKADETYFSYNVIPLDVVKAAFNDLISILQKE